MKDKIIKVLLENTSKIGVSETDAKNVFEENLGRMRIDFSDYKEESLLKKALLNTLGYFKSLNRGTGGKVFEAIIIGKGAVYDAYKKEREEAINKGYVGENGEPIFFDERFSWRLNKPIPAAGSDESYSQRLYGLLKLEDSDEIKLSVIYVNNKKKIDEAPELNKLYKIRLSCKDENLNNDILFVNSIAATRFSLVEDKIVDIQQLINSVAPNSIFSFNELELSDTQSLPLQIGFARATVTKINFTNDDVSSNVVEVMPMAETLDIDNLDSIDIDNVEPKTIWVNKAIDINFGVGSDVLICYQKSSNDALNAVGFYVINSTAPEVKPKPLTVNEETPKQKSTGQLNLFGEKVEDSVWQKVGDSE